MKFETNIICLAVLILSSCQPNNKTEQTEQNTIIFKDSLGKTISKADLSNVTGKVNYEIMDTKSIDPKAKNLHNESRELGQSGKYDLAIAKLEQAIQIQSDWAYPVYDLAYTYLLKGDYENAFKFYKQTDSLEPKGFFTTKTAL